MPGPAAQQSYPQSAPRGRLDIARATASDQVAGFYGWLRMAMAEPYLVADATGRAPPRSDHTGKTSLHPAVWSTDRRKHEAVNMTSGAFWRALVYDGECVALDPARAARAWWARATSMLSRAAANRKRLLIPPRRISTSNLSKQYRHQQATLFFSTPRLSGTATTRLPGFRPAGSEMLHRWTSAQAWLSR